jgi:hypothetical protein
MQLFNEISYIQSALQFYDTHKITRPFILIQCTPHGIIFLMGISVITKRVYTFLDGLQSVLDAK